MTKQPRFYTSLDMPEALARRSYEIGQKCGQEARYRYNDATLSHLNAPYFAHRKRETWREIKTTLLIYGFVIMVILAPIICAQAVFPSLKPISFYLSPHLFMRF